MKFTIVKTRLNLYNYAKSQSRRLAAFSRSIKYRVIIILKTLRAIFQLLQALERLIKETEKAKEEIINMEVRTSQLYASFNYLYANIHEISKQTGVSIQELDMNKLPSRKTLGH
ncbi:MAG: hypothetical protein ACFFC7_30110 [Candidatus Hermodarchaeota archaeon]